MDKNSFILYTNYYDILKDLNDTDAGLLFKAILAYQATGEILKLPNNLDLAFRFIKNQLDIDSEKYKKFSEKQKANGLRGGRPKKEENPKNPKNPTVFLKTQKSLNDNVNVNDNDNVNVNEKIPSKNEVEDYCKQIGKKIKIDDFMEYYNAAQWKDKNNLQINWKQKVITWGNNKKVVDFIEKNEVKSHYRNAREITDELQR